MEDELVAPAPPEYAEMTIEEAFWTSFGKHPEDMTYIEYSTKVAMLSARARQQQKKRSQ